MKLSFFEIILLAVVVILLTLTGVWGFNVINLRNNPPAMAQKMSLDLDAKLNDLNKGLSDLYLYQKTHNIKAAELRVLAVDRRTYETVMNNMRKQQGKAPAPAAVKTTMGVK